MILILTYVVKVILRMTTSFNHRSLFVKIINKRNLKNDISFLKYETEIFCFKVYFTTFYAKRL